MLENAPTITPQHHAVFLQAEFGGGGTRIPILYLECNGQIKPVKELITYFSAFPNRSTTWQRAVARSIGLFWDYCIATRNDSSIWKSENPHRLAFRRFTLALLKGTLSIDDHSDRWGLYWPPTSQANVKKLSTALHGFITWCEDEGLVSRLSVSPKTAPISPEETMSFLYTAIKIKNYSLLSHLKNTTQIAELALRASRERLIDLGPNIQPAYEDSEVIAFPRDLLAPLLTHGFIVNENPDLEIYEQEDITAKMVTLLLAFGGTRNSEPFHLWFNDVVPGSENKCKVFLRHPSDSLTYIQGEGRKTRRMYLLERNLPPRNARGLSKSYKAGWKNLKTDQTLTAPVFFVHKEAEVLFREMYLYYLRYRGSLLRQRQLTGKPDHPFLFVSRGKDASEDESYVGEPYSISAYKGALQRAYDRLERRYSYSISRGKYDGTTPHGFRHLYGRLLGESGLDQKTIQTLLRHRSPMSQGVYTTPTFNRITASLESAREKITESNPTVFNLQNRGNKYRNG
jgi:hypothetical protein